MTQQHSSGVVEQMRLRGLVALGTSPWGGAEKWEALDLPTAGLLDSPKLHLIP